MNNELNMINSGHPFFSLPNNEHYDFHFEATPRQQEETKQLIQREIHEARTKNTWQTIKNLFIAGAIAIPIMFGIFATTVPEVRIAMSQPAFSYEYRMPNTLQVNDIKLNAIIDSSKKTDIQPGLTFVHDSNIGEQNNGYKDIIKELSGDELSQFFIQQIHNSGSQVYVLTEPNTPVNAYNLAIGEQKILFHKISDKKSVIVMDRAGMKQMSEPLQSAWQNELAEQYMSSIGQGDIMKTREFQVAHLAVNNFAHSPMMTDLNRQKSAASSYQKDQIIEHLNNTIKLSYKADSYKKDPQLGTEKQQSFQQSFDHLLDLYKEKDPVHYGFLQHIKTEFSQDGTVHFV